jgi:sulfur carrier protein ThiS adenylyltransferase
MPAERSALVAGVGNIGSHLAPLLLRAGFTVLRLVDRDRVEAKNLTAQDYRPEDVDRKKAEVQAERLRAPFPHARVEAWAGDLEDLPLGLAEVDVVFGALDSRRARQVLVSEIAWPLGVPVVDGGVGEPAVGRVQVFVPTEDNACLECTWGQADYRSLAAEYPCVPGASARAAPTAAPAYLGSLVASLMVHEALRVLGTTAPMESYEVPFDLGALALRRFALRRSQRCRHDHAVTRERVNCATAGDALRALRERFGEQPVRLECRRGVLGASRFGGVDVFEVRDEAPLSALGLAGNDRIRACAPAGSVWVVVRGEE